MIEAVRSYLALLRSRPEAESDSLQALAAALDRLACAYHAVSEIVRAEVPDFPDHTTYQEMREIAAARFPNLGFYAVVPPVEDLGQQAMMGDAIDDLADIALEMERVEWLWSHARTQEAEWHFRFWYRAHWGRHLQDLRSYVHSRQFENR